MSSLKDARHMSLGICLVTAKQEDTPCCKCITLVKPFYGQKEEIEQSVKTIEKLLMRPDIIVIDR